MNDIQVFLRDKNFNIVGEVSEFDQFEATLTFNKIGKFVLNYSYDKSFLTSDQIELLSYMKPYNGVVVKRNGVIIFSGPILRRRDGWLSGKRSIELSGADDIWELSTRVCLPVVDGSAFSGSSHDVRSGVCETILYEYVNYNLGALATFPRRRTGLKLGIDLERGDVITGRARFCGLLDLLQAIALAGGGLRFDVMQSGAGIVFQVYEPDDKTVSVVFGSDLGNLSSTALLEDMPTGNYVYVGGQGDLTARAFVERLDSHSIQDYGRIEFFTDQRNEPTVSNLAIWGDADLQKNGAGITIEAKAIETEYPVWGVDYGLGDLVTVIVDGITYIESVRSVNLRISQQTTTVQPIIGTVTAKTSGLGLTSKLDEMNSRIKTLETE
jgi:hypothetical protein